MTVRDIVGRRQPTQPLASPGCYIGVVVAVDWPKMECSALVEQLNDGKTLKRIPISEGPWVRNHATKRTPIGPDGGHQQYWGWGGEHTHAPHRHLSGKELAPGDRIVLLPKANQPRSLVMLTRLAAVT